MTLHMTSIKIKLLNPSGMNKALGLLDNYFGLVVGSVARRFYLTKKLVFLERFLLYYYY